MSSLDKKTAISKFKELEQRINSGEGGSGGPVDWADVQNKPGEFTPEEHSHAEYAEQTEVDALREDLESLEIPTGEGGASPVLDTNWRMLDNPDLEEGWQGNIALRRVGNTVYIAALGGSPVAYSGPPAPTYPSRFYTLPEGWGVPPMLAVALASQATPAMVLNHPSFGDPAIFIGSMGDTDESPASLFSGTYITDDPFPDEADWPGVDLSVAMSGF